MIAAETIDRIKEMLRDGSCSQRTIARTLGVSRGTVNAVALGKRRKSSGPAAGRFVPPAGPPRRCGGCGGLVQMPCLLCYIRNRRRRRGPPE